MIGIAPATSEDQLQAARTLMRAFVAWHRERHLEDLHLLDEYFDVRAFEAELASLPGKYSPPAGRLLVAQCEGEYAGCVALRPLGGDACEMKRMFVYPQFQGRGIGGALAEAVIEEARSIGYALMRLDTSFRQAEAQTLYRKFGFERIDPYYELPDSMKNWLVFMQRTL
jgi:GNAT superfamily N-acetyltransferase